MTHYQRTDKRWKRQASQGIFSIFTFCSGPSKSTSASPSSPEINWREISTGRKSKQRGRFSGLCSWEWACQQRCPVGGRCPGGWLGRLPESSVGAAFAAVWWFLYRWVLCSGSQGNGWMPRRPYVDSGSIIAHLCDIGTELLTFLYLNFSPL